MKTILTSHFSLPSSVLLKHELEESLGEKIKVTTHPEKVKNLIIRYGCSAGSFNPEANLNSSDFIRILVDKKRFSDLLLEHQIYTPNFSKNLEEIKDFPIVIRETLHSSKGRGIHIVETRENFDKIWNNRFYWTNYIQMKYELRVHILGGKIVKVFKKCWHNENKEEEKYPIRTNENYSFVLQNMEKYKKLPKLVEKLSEIFGNDCFYSLDLGWDDHKKDYFILEANSAPGLNSLTCKLYAEFFIERLGLK